MAGRGSSIASPYVCLPASSPAVQRDPAVLRGAVGRALALHHPPLAPAADAAVTANRPRSCNGTTRSTGSYTTSYCIAASSPCNRRNKSSAGSSLNPEAFFQAAKLPRGRYSCCSTSAKSSTSRNTTSSSSSSRSRRRRCFCSRSNSSTRLRSTREIGDGSGSASVGASRERLALLS